MKIAFTLATNNYLAYAKTLADSVIAHNPNYTCIIGITDRLPAAISCHAFEPHILVEVEQLGLPFLQDMLAHYTIFEFCNAFKPMMAQYILKTYPATDTLIYLDSDMLVFDAFTYVETQLQTHSICLTPHVLTPIPDDGHTPETTNFNLAGIYNGGFWAIRPTAESHRFLDWWTDTLRTKCVVNVRKGLFVDQIWLNFVPSFFEGVCLVKHPGYNMAYYNMHERHLTQKSGAWYVNDTFPLVVFHYTGFSPSQPMLLSKHQNRFSFKSRPDVKPVFQLYEQTLMTNQLAAYMQLEFGFSRPSSPWWKQLLKRKK